ncbi:MAG: hypothetical protein ACLT8E_08595 [Akkermansia sp.]
MKKQNRFNPFFKTSKDILSPPSSNTIDPFFIGKEKERGQQRFTQFLDAGLRRFSKDVKQTAFQPQDQWADPENPPEIVVFTGSPAHLG